MRAFTYQSIAGQTKLSTLFCDLPYKYRAHVIQSGDSYVVTTCDSTWECEDPRHMIRWWVKALVYTTAEPAICLDIGPSMYEAIKRYRANAVFPFERSILETDLVWNTVCFRHSLNTLYSVENRIKQAKYNLDTDGIKHKPDTRWKVPCHPVWHSPRDANFLIKFE